MKMNRIAAAIRSFLALGVAENTTSYTTTYSARATDITSDPAAMFGMLSFRKNVNDFVAPDLVAIAGGTATTFTLTAAQFLNWIIDFTSTASSGIALTTPTAAQILGSLSPNVPQAGFNWLMIVMNDGSGQTVTFTAGANVTLSATTATIANNTARIFLVNTNVNAGTVNIIGIGGGLTL